MLLIKVLLNHISIIIVSLSTIKKIVLQRFTLANDAYENFKYENVTYANRFSLFKCRLWHLDGTLIIKILILKMSPMQINVTYNNCAYDIL